MQRAENILWERNVLHLCTNQVNVALSTGIFCAAIAQNIVQHHMPSSVKEDMGAIFYLIRNITNALDKKVIIKYWREIRFAILTECPLYP